MSDQYILEGHEPVRCHSLFEWAKWFETAERHVGKTIVAIDIKVSTVFLGLDHQYGDGEPILFETMVFGGKHDQEMERYSTWEQAEEGHKRWVNKLKPAPQS